MTINLAVLLRDGWSLWRRDRTLLLPVAGLLLFLPDFAVQLLVPRFTGIAAEPTTDEATRAMAQGLLAWIGAYGGWILLAQIASLWGIATIWTLYLDRRRLTVSSALAPGLGVMGRYILAMLVVSAGVMLIGAPIAALLGLIIPVSALGAVVIAPLFYLLARLLVTGPVIVAERPSGPIAALRRSWQLTRGQGWPLAWVVASLTLAGYLVAAFALGVGDMMASNSGDNPVVVGITAGIAVVAQAAAALAVNLIAVAVYRRLASSGH